MVSRDRDERGRSTGHCASRLPAGGIFQHTHDFQGTGESWGDKVRPFEHIVDEADPVESSLVNDVARLYPVRTRFSRFLLGNADVDGYLVLRRPIDGNFRDFRWRLAGDRPTSRQGPLRSAATALYFTTTTQGQAAVMRFIQQEGPRNESAADRSVQTLGFRSRSSGFCPMGVSPDLVGKQAPDFSLQTLTVDGSNFTRPLAARSPSSPSGASPAAPAARSLLTADDRYKKQGLTVIGVNAYNESRQKVEGFVRAKHLTHTIALMGGKVPRDYTVASYPVTWLVDRNGKIADYLLGFDPGDEKLLDKSIARLLQ